MDLNLPPPNHRFGSNTARVPARNGAMEHEELMLIPVIMGTELDKYDAVYDSKSCSGVFILSDDDGYEDDDEFEDDDYEDDDLEEDEDEDEDEDDYDDDYDEDEDDDYDEDEDDDWDDED